jgi:hypothetical protein
MPRNGRLPAGQGRPDPRSENGHRADCGHSRIDAGLSDASPRGMGAPSWRAERPCECTARHETEAPARGAKGCATEDAGRSRCDSQAGHRAPQCTRHLAGKGCDGMLHPREQGTSRPVVRGAGSGPTPQLRSEPQLQLGAV